MRGAQDRAHPRSRGENGHGRREHLRPRGSSPLTRGKLRHLLAQTRRGRLIPAHAGKTAWLVDVELTAGAHPRSRGENVRVTSRSARRPGLIPAHAGKTTRFRRLPRRGRAHPRSRGENVWVAIHVRFAMGSSPLTRGKQDRGRGRVRRRGLIPAHAGKTCPLPIWWGCVRAHPRSRGENDLRSPLSEQRDGSSPLTRGKPRVRARVE